MKALKIFRAIWLAILLISAVFVITCVILKWDIIPVMTSGYDARLGSLLVNSSDGFKLLEVPFLGYAAYYCWTLIGKIVIGVITALLLVSFFLDDKFDKKKKVAEEDVEVVAEEVQAANVSAPTETKVIEKSMLTDNMSDISGFVSNSAVVLTPENAENEEFDRLVNRTLEERDIITDLETENFEKFLDENMHEVDREPQPEDEKMNGLDMAMQSNPIELFEEDDVVEEFEKKDIENNQFTEVTEDMMEDFDVEEDDEEIPEAEMEDIRKILNEHDYDMDITSEDLEKYLNYESNVSEVEEAVGDVDTEMSNDEINTDLVDAVKSKNIEIDNLNAALLAANLALEEEKKKNALKVKELEDVVSATKEEKDKQIQKKVQSMEDSKKSFRAEIDKLKKELKALTDEKAELQKSVEKAQNDAATLQKSAEKAQNEVAALKKSAEKAQNEVAALQKDVKAAKAENKALAESAKEVEHLKTSHKTEIDGLKGELAAALKESENMKAKNLGFESDIEKFKKRIVELENHLKRTIDANEKNKETFIMMSDDLAKNKTEIENLKKIDKRYEDLYNHYMKTLEFLLKNKLISKEASEREQRAFKK